ncbi:two-component regulator propeller domain-containing protein [Spirosoma sp.]|uniref:two-component regulator propeller domain-containing protein n=1 Tax=Spirosoma sp. TaxID=1899569 RepID=UPI002639A52C|nr:two-component regulator propeller domain-containing protein [Spirosoma sp.]MCX6218011.1 triple tyrosine motif-containing protein [Spirosoma sp.]
MNTHRTHFDHWFESVCARWFGWYTVMFILSVSFSRTSAQPAADKFDHLSTKNGLSNNSVNCILQDREGFMWFGTNDGLNKYDGYSFQVFQTDPARPAHSLTDNRIMGLCEDPKNRLWVVTEGAGLHEVNKQTGDVTHHPIHANHENWWNNQVSVYADRQGVLWLCSYGGLIRYEPESHHFTLYPSPKREVPVKSVFEDRQNRFWVATSQGLYLFDRQTGHFALLPIQKAMDPQPWFGPMYLDSNDVLWLGAVGKGLFQLDLRHPPLQIVPYAAKGTINKYMYLSALHRDQQGFMWMGTTDGLQRIDTKTAQVFTYLPDPDALHNLGSINVQAVFHDRAGTLWAGTDNGIDKQALNTKPFTTYQIRRSIGIVNLPENKVATLAIDSRNRVWFSNQEKLYRLNLRTNQITEIPASLFGNASQHKNNLHALLPDGPDGIWIGTWNGLYRLNQTTNHSVKFPTEIAAQFVSRDAHGLLWLSGEGGVASFNPVTHQFHYYKYDPSDTSGLPEKYIYGMLVSQTGDIWLTLRGKGLSRLNPQSGRFTHYTAGLKPGQLNSNEIGTIYEDRSGTIWLGSTRGGLNWFDPKTGKFSHLTTKDGLPSDWIIGITEDNRGYLWLSTNKGLCRFDPRTKSFRPYDNNDGLPNNDFRVNTVSRSGNSLFFGTLNGLVRFNPDSIQTDRQPFPVYVTTFKVGDSLLPVTRKQYTLAHHENYLSFEFVALTYGLPERNQYAYKLSGIDNDWVKNGSRRFASYTNLPPGKYTFQVKAANSDGVWRQLESPLTIQILTPWWQTWPAYVLYALIGLGIMWALATYRSRKLLLANRRLEDIIANRTNEIRRQSDQLALQRDSLEKTLTELTSTQRQLIHREKMASLGELTAGIAHEIQNPLNFVNNFSEVSAELAGELLDLLANGQQANAATLASYIQTNLQKITHHGKRADSIVKNMLQHTRFSNGKKFPTNLNKLIDEHLRLAYQGVRVNDKSLTVHLVTDFDSTLSVLDVVPQDIGRVLLNLFNNAFYSIAAKQKGGAVDYEPEIRVSTRRHPTFVELRIRDNGLGIPQTVLEKIYQPFFTTKPSGQGTGLGLSLSYDIITKGHEGELSVDTSEGQFAEFIIKLPLPPA